MKLTQGRRVEGGIEDLERGGDYVFEPDAKYAVDPETQEVIERRSTIWFLLPGARDNEAHGGRRAVHRVTVPPWVFRDCPDGSIEVRESIAAGDYWHGYLDEGHVWREL